MAKKKGKKRLTKKAKARIKKSFWGRLWDDDDPLLVYSVSEQVGREIVAIVLAVLAVFLLLSLAGYGGALGSFTAQFMRQVFGIVTFIIPVLLGIGSFEFFKPKGTDIRVAGAIGGVLFLVSFTALLHNFWAADPLTAAQGGVGGGMVGYWIGGALTQAVGKVVAIIIEFGFTLIAIILVLDVPITNLLGLTPREAGPENDGVRINQLGAKAPVFETIRRIGFRGRKGQVPVGAGPLAPNPLAGVGTALTSASNTGFQLPNLEILETSDTVAESGDIAKNVEKIQLTLKNFGITVAMGEVNVGPTVTQYTCKPAEGVKLNQITARANDLALALAAKSIRIEAPIPGKSAVGIEVPNQVRAKVTVREILESAEFRKQKGSLLTMALGRDVAGIPIVADIEQMPHMLIAGATGSGKSVMINSIILSLLFQNTPETLRFVFVDPKRVELSMYNHIPHLLTPVITEADKTIAALKWSVSEMDRRYRLFSDTGRRNIQSFNESLPEGQQKMPFIVLIIDELADLMSVAAREVEGAIVRLAQMARATGIHIIVATQRPSVDVITGLIKANITSRIAFATASQADSRTILDMSGADKLLGNGDMLFMSNDLGKPRRVQGTFSSDQDINNVIAHVKGQGMAQYDEGITVRDSNASGVMGGEHSGGGNSDEDELYRDAVSVVTEARKASASLLQRRLRIGYARAARLLDILEDNGVVGPADGARPREVYGEGSGGSGGGSDQSNQPPPANNIQAYPE